MARALEIDEVVEGSTHVLTLVGRLDTNTSSQLEAVSSRIVAANRTAQIVLDMEGCAFVSSAGLRVLVAMQKRATTGGSLTLRHVSPEVMSVLTSSGIADILTIED